MTDIYLHIDARLTDTELLNQVDAVGWTALMHAADSGNLQLVRHLLAQGAAPNCQCERTGALAGGTALFFASLAGHMQVVEVCQPCMTEIYIHIDARMAE